MNTFNFRDEIIAITHRWYVIMLFILIGALLGWSASYLWPSPYRATKDLYVGINAYRSPYDSYAEHLAGQSFRMVDDYKNWQMEQLNDLILTEDFIQKTLASLQDQSPFWLAVSVQDFRVMAKALWRNVGEWHLVVEAPDPDLATQGIAAWEAVIFEDVNQAIDHARQVVSLDIQMTTLADARLQHSLRQQKLEYVLEQITARQKNLATSPVNQTVSAKGHWDLLGVVAQAVAWNPAWDRILDEAPVLGSTTDLYLSWLDHVRVLIEQELSLMPEQGSLLDEQFSSLDVQYREETAKSLGLASTLVIERDEEGDVVTEKVRPGGTLTLAGGVLGFLFWGLWAFRIISVKNT